MLLLCKTWALRYCPTSPMLFSLRVFSRLAIPTCKCENCSDIYFANLLPRYCASRTLYSLSLDGHAPKILRKCTKAGVPIYCFMIVMIFPFLSFLQISSGSAQVITWLANLTEAAQIIDYIGMAVVYLYFYRALKFQGMSRDDLPYKGWWQVCA